MGKFFIESCATCPTPILGWLYTCKKEKIYREERKEREGFLYGFLSDLPSTARQGRCSVLGGSKKEFNMTINDQYNKWKENTLKKSLDKFKERKERFETSAGIEVPRVALPAGFDTDERHRYSTTG